MNDVPRIFLKQKEDKEISLGFPWIFDNEIESVKYLATDGSGWKKSTLADIPPEAGADGTLVDVYAHAGGFLACGVINRRSKITVRIIADCHADIIAADTAAFWSKRVRDAVNIRRLQYADTESYRLIFGEADGMPGLIVERFCDVSGRIFLVVQFLARACEAFRTDILAALTEACTPYGIYERSDAHLRAKEGLPEAAGWLGTPRETVITIVENGVQLLVDIALGQKTGYFLDHKENRRVAAAYCRGKRVLDMFSHTGAFALVAAAAGARDVTAVDSSPEAVTFIKQNANINGAAKTVHAVCADAFAFLRDSEARGEKFDVIILDPPAFTKNAKMIQKAYSGYKEINVRAMRLLNAGGILVSCSCSSFFDAPLFYNMLTHAARDCHRRVQVLQKRGAGADHPVLLGYPKSEYLKCAVLRVL
ncbi:MAG: class I SAM-dependent rRNA methyltransferase [Treponema sp.]|nr:class I SAM-dependent rRNA methyltransferase [Treponema sp.]